MRKDLSSPNVSLRPAFHDLPIDHFGSQVNIAVKKPKTEKAGAVFYSPKKPNIESDSPHSSIHELIAFAETVSRIDRQSIIDHKADVESLQSQLQRVRQKTLDRQQSVDAAAKDDLTWSYMHNVAMTIATCLSMGLGALQMGVGIATGDIVDLISGGALIAGGGLSLSSIVANYFGASDEIVGSLAAAGLVISLAGGAFSSQNIFHGHESVETFIKYVMSIGVVSEAAAGIGHAKTKQSITLLHKDLETLKIEREDIRKDVEKALKMSEPMLDETQLAVASALDQEARIREQMCAVGRV